MMTAVIPLALLFLLLATGQKTVIQDGDGRQPDQTPPDEIPPPGPPLPKLPKISGLSTLRESVQEPEPPVGPMVTPNGIAEIRGIESVVPVRPTEPQYITTSEPTPGAFYQITAEKDSAGLSGVARRALGNRGGNLSLRTQMMRAINSSSYNTGQWGAPSGAYYRGATNEHIGAAFFPPYGLIWIPVVTIDGDRLTIRQWDP